MEVRFLQTADQVKYRVLLDLSSQTVREYCARHAFSYECFLGIVRGYHAWQASYNRIPLLKRMMNDGYSGWVCYLDADALVFDLDFDLRAYLADKGDIAVAATPGEPTNPLCAWWNVNSGVFLINLGHPVGRSVVSRWADLFDGLTDEMLRGAEVWHTITDDQIMLHQALQDCVPSGQNILIDRGNPPLLNYEGGRFTRQILRVLTPTFQERVQYLQAEVNAVLGSAYAPTRSARPDMTNMSMEELVTALYRAALLRDPEPGGLGHSVRQMQAGLSFEELMRSVFRSDEFAENVPVFLSTHLGPEFASGRRVAAQGEEQ